MFDWMQQALDRFRDDGLERVRRELTSASGTKLRWQGREYLSFASNDYLGLAGDFRLAANGGWNYGTGAGASPLITGWSVPQQRLERDLADWHGTVAALTFSSGYATNVGVIPALCHAGDTIVSDELNHASLIDGCRLSRATVRVSRHNDVGHIRELLSRSPTGRRWIVADSVFSMDGDRFPLADVLDAAREYDAAILLDEAHATGVVGPAGVGLAGTVDADERIVVIGTLSKSIGAQGGFVCSSQRVIDYLIHTCRSWIFSTSLAPPTAGAAIEGIRIIRQDRLLRERLQANIALLSARLGRPINPSAIFPFPIGRAAEAVRASERLLEMGILVPAIRPPTVPADGCRLRISLSAAHTEEDIDRLAEGLKSSGGTGP